MNTTKVDGVHLTGPYLHVKAAELGISTKDGTLIVYNASKECQEIIDDNALAAFVTMALNVSPETISNIKEVKVDSV